MMREVEAVARAVQALADCNVPPDVQELLLHGNPSRSVRPGALLAALDAARGETVEHSLGMYDPTPTETLDEPKKYVRREDFCERYWRDSGVPFERINALQGYVQHDRHILAAALCDCGDDECQGWQMQCFAIQGETADERQAAIVAALRKLGSDTIANWIESGEWRR
jgi:hypothetical protein